MFLKKYFFWIIHKNSTILQVCDEVGIDIPRFCFHERLLVAGNCRMCLVEIEKSPKSVQGYTIPVMENMKVYTKIPLVKRVQKFSLFNFVIKILLKQLWNKCLVPIFICRNYGIILILFIITWKKTEL